MNHSVRPGTNDQHAQTEGLQALLVPKASIHRHQDIKTPMSASKKLAIMGPGPPGGLHGSDLVSRQFGDKITRQVLVKQNVHRPTSTFVRGLVRQRPALARRTETDPGTDRASRHLPDSRTVSLPARVCRRIPVFRRRFRNRCARPKTNRYHGDRRGTTRWRDQPWSAPSSRARTAQCSPPEHRPIRGARRLGGLALPAPTRPLSWRTDCGVATAGHGDCASR